MSELRSGREARERHAESVVDTSPARSVELLGERPPFASLDHSYLHRLAATLERFSLPAATEIVREGETSEGVCYFLLEGDAEVVVRYKREEENGSTAGAIGAAGAAGERRLAALVPGDLFGEAPLLTNSLHHAATVRALSPCEVLVIPREELLWAMRTEGEVAERIRDLLALRHLPKRAAGIVAHRSAGPEGTETTTLKDPARGAYFRLSEGGLFIWRRLDGHHTLQDLMLAYYEEFGSFEPQAVAEIVERLTGAGFAEGVRLSEEASETLPRPTRLQMALSSAREILEWRVVIGGMDAPISRLYSGGIGLLYTKVAQVLLALVTLAGLAAFAFGIGNLGSALTETQAGGWLLLFWIPSSVAAILIHEAGHAFTTRHYGREVPIVGVGWYWFGPIAYVDTSDMWLEGRRWPRIAVSLAGPYADMVVGGVAAIAALLSPEPILAAFLWQFALVSYIGILINLNPLMEFDGYYILIDWLERPNLRPRALSWLGTEALAALRSGGLRGLIAHRLELLYALSSLIYIALMAALTVVLYRLVVEGWLAGLIGEAAASGTAWVLAGAVVVLASVGVLGELRGAPRGRAPGL